MEQQDPNTTKRATKTDEHSHSKHMWMMAACCGLPIIGFLAIGALGIDAPSLETLVALVCPIAMVGMMMLMAKSDKPKAGNDHSRRQQEESQAQPQDNTAVFERKARAANHIPSEQPGSFEA